MEARYKPYVHTEKSLLQGVNCNILFSGFQQKPEITFLHVGPASWKKKIKKPTKNPKNLISIMAVLILQTEDHVLTEHSNDTSDPNILWFN